jgi:hypothetical protein
MARTRYPDDPDRAELEVRAAFEVQQTAAYVREDGLYGPYREGMGDERAFLESLERQPPSATHTDIRAANARLTEARA